MEEGEGVGAAGYGDDEARAGSQGAAAQGVPDEGIDTLQYAGLFAHGAVAPIPSTSSGQAIA